MDRPYRAEQGKDALPVWQSAFSFYGSLKPFLSFGKRKRKKRFQEKHL